MINEIGTSKPKEPTKALDDKFKDLHLKLLVLEVLAHALMYNAIQDKYVESLELGKNGSAFIQGKTPEKIKDPGLFTLPCSIGDSKPFDTLADLGSYKRFLSTANAVIDCRKTKIAVEEGVTRSIYGVKEINLREEEVPYWTTLGKWESYTPRPSTDGIGARPSYYAKKDFVDYHLLERIEFRIEMSRLNPLRMS
ncbi:hypothetical protein Tco_0448351 [Tanacetum coccineum]